MSISYAVFCLIRPPPTSPLFPYTTLFRSDRRQPPGNPPWLAGERRWIAEHDRSETAASTKTRPRSDYSGLMPANFTTLAHFSVSAAMNLPKIGRAHV